MRFWAREQPREDSLERMPRSVSGWWAAPAAAIGGYALDIATPGIEWWPAAFIGTVLIMGALWQQTAKRGFVLGLLAGAAFWFPHISWLTLYLGPIPWLALGTVMMLWFGLFGLGASLATRGLARMHLRPALRAAVQAVSVTGLWIVREQVQSTWPYGGFAWGRLAHTQARGPLAETVSWIGFSGLSALIALVCACFVALLIGMRPTRKGQGLTPARHLRIAVGTAASLVVVTIGASFIPAAALPQSGTLAVAAVQGNSKSGIFDDRDSGDVLRDHLDVTEQLIEDLDAAGESVDVIVWPENSAEFNFPDNGFGGLQLSRLSRLAEAPIVIGSVLPRDGGMYTNSALVWGPDGELQGADGDSLHYDKRFPVPFAEYMPHRSFYHALVPHLVDLVQLEYTAGERPSAFEIPIGSESFSAGLAICFDIIFDAQAGAMIDAGAEVIFAQTNNADFGRTDESAQQLQIAHLRAVESGRSLVNISTVGTSAIVLPDGTEVDRLVPFTGDAMVADVPLHSGRTPALIFGAAITAVWITAGLAGLVLGSAATWMRRRERRHQE